MTQVVFDTLKYADDLKQAGVDPNLAESLARVQSEAFSNLIDDTLATKGDMLQLEQRLTNKMYALFIANIGILGGLMTLLRFF